MGAGQRGEGLTTDGGPVMEEAEAVRTLGQSGEEEVSTKTLEAEVHGTLSGNVEGGGNE